MARDKKVFQDFLKEYRRLRYLFEYGFKWDSAVTELLEGEKASMYRDIQNVIDGWNTIAHDEWEAEPGEKKSSKRKIVNKRHYQVKKNQWIPFAYGIYGARYDQMERTDPAFWYKPSEKEEAAKVFSDFSDLPEQPKVCKDWTAEMMRNEGIFTALRRDKQGDGYEQFLLMLSFFAEFAPLSVLGYNFLRRLGREELTNPYIFVRRPFIHDALEQESIFRCLYAILNGYCVKIENLEYEPIRIYYADADFEIEKAKLYLEARKKKKNLGKSSAALRELHNREEQISVQVEFYYLPKGETEYLENRRDESFWQGYEKERRVLSELHRMKSPYYKQEEWKCCRIWYCIKPEDLEGFYLFIQSFGDFAKIVEEKFAEETAHICLSGGIEVKVIESGRRRKAESGFLIKNYFKENSLCNAYNSNYYLQRAAHGKELEPTAAEIAWIRLVLKEYPAFAKIFLTEDEYEGILKKISDYEGKGILPDFYKKTEPSADGKVFPVYDWMPRCFDLRADSTLYESYRELLLVIQKQCVLRYKADKKDRVVRVLPYAVEYHVIRHSIKPNKEPFRVMCYDLDEKRVSVVERKALKLKSERIPVDEYRDFTVMDKLFHLLSYAVRSAMCGRDGIAIEYAKYITQLFRVNSGEADPYDRCIGKKVRNGRPAPICLEKWDCGHRFRNNSWRQMVSEFNQRVFTYYIRPIPDSPELKKEQFKSIAEKELIYFEWIYQMLIKSAWYLDDMSCIRFEKAMKKIADMPDQLVWKLIIGEDIDSVPNEITYYDEVLKCESVYFELKTSCMKDKEQLPYWIRKIYEVFGGYICKGSYDEKVRRLSFTIQYERFNYRDIHMRIMTLRNIISFESILPEKEWRRLYGRMVNTEPKLSYGTVKFELNKSYDGEAVEKSKAFRKDQAKLKEQFKQYKPSAIYRNDRKHMELQVRYPWAEAQKVYAHMKQLENKGLLYVRDTKTISIWRHWERRYGEKK